MQKIEIELAEDLFLFVKQAAKVNGLPTEKLLSILVSNFLKSFAKGLTIRAEDVQALTYGM